MDLKNNVQDILGARPLGQTQDSGRQPATRLVKSDLSRTSKPVQQITFYQTKVTQMGEYFEIMHTEQPVFCNINQQKKNKKRGTAINKKTRIKNKKRNAWRTKQKIIQLVRTNFTKNAKFLTLTFDDNQQFNIKSIPVCNKYFSLFIRRLSRKYPSLKYIGVIEFQDKKGRGAVHYHIIHNLPFVHWSELKKMWGHGDIHITRPKSLKHVMYYVPKYLNKNATDPRFEKHRSLKYSKNLKKPASTRGPRAELLAEKIPEHFKQVEEPNTYESKFHGTVTKTLYLRVKSPAHKE